MEASRGTPFAGPVKRLSTPGAQQRLIGRHTGAATCNVNWHGKTNADKETLIGWIRQAGYNADDLPVTVEQWPAGIARIDRGVNLDQPLQPSIAILHTKGAIKARDNAR